MSNLNLPLDQSARDSALDATTSFIVQAPAGSGKTSLLTQRFLKLLSTVNNPEEVLAITFTRKAAAEMKNRLLEALHLATGDMPEEHYLQTTWNLAKKVLERDSQLEWGLLLHSARLKIQTIDSLCSSLTRQLPILSGLGGNLTLLDSADEYYQQAAERTVLMVEDGDYTDLLLPLVSHLDGNLARLQRLIAWMLSNRLNWAGVTGVKFQRTLLDSAWKDWIERRISNLEKLMGKYRQQLQPLWIYSCNQLARENSATQNDWGYFASLEWPENSLDGLLAWQTIADLLLTGKNEFRKTITKKHGFLAPSSTKNSEEKALYAEKKTQFNELMEIFSETDESEIEELLLALGEIKLLPLPGFSDEHWRVLESLGVALKFALAQLWVIFDEFSVIDFSEITVRAQQALGTTDSPTDLALRIDYQISHILVDEFQDTSQSQRNLLSLLTAGWQIDDGRSLFVVGDPMQSIYRFRAAEVSIFLEAWHQQQLAGVSLKQLSLTTNFRSKQSIVDWVNSAFIDIFPANDDEQLGAVQYSSAVSMDTSTLVGAIQVLPICSRNDDLEAQWIIDKISTVRENNVADSCAILVRSKAHLVRIAPLLRAAEIPFEAVDIESLMLQPVVQDLFSLTAAMLNDADRLHWLAILRAPWCGLSLTDLTLLVDAKVDQQKTVLIPELLADTENWQQLSDDGQLRLKKFTQIIHHWMKLRGQRNLAGWIESLWTSLQGPASTKASVNDNALEDANSYFQLLSAQENAGNISLKELYVAVKDLYAKPEQGLNNPVYLMSMHKSKGLEFDHVFLPGLGRRTKGVDQPLLEWMQWPKPEGDVDLLLAPIRGAHEETNPFYKVLQAINKQKAIFESQRLLYVAVTRAKRCLYLSGHIKDSEATTPDSSSLLNLLWPMLKNNFENLEEAEEEEAINPLAETLARLDVGLKLAKTEKNYTENNSIEQLESTLIEFEWANERARVIGLIAHKLFQWLATFESLPETNSVENITPWFMAQLQSFGLDNSQSRLALKKLQQLSKNILSSERGRWILTSSHSQIKSEWPLATIDTNDSVGNVSKMIVDRSFIDNKGIRWIIDYKTGTHEGGNLEQYLASEKARYRPQLEKYGRAVSQLETSTIMLGIYFVAMDEWIEWPLI